MALWKLLPLQKEKQEKEKKKKKEKIRTIMADCMKLESVTVTATFHYVCLWVMINEREVYHMVSKEGLVLWRMLFSHLGSCQDYLKGKWVFHVHVPRLWWTESNCESSTIRRVAWDYNAKVCIPQLQNFWKEVSATECIYL